MSTGRLVGVKALDSSVERLWFNLQSTSRQFLSSFQSPPVSSGVQSITNHHIIKIKNV